VKTFQDFEKAKDDKPAFILAAIGDHKASDAYKTAKTADEYDAQRNTTIAAVTRTIYNAQGVAVEDYTVSNMRIASNFFNRLNTQRCMYSLANGVTFVDPYDEAQEQLTDETKEKLGEHFDHVLREAAYYALIHGRSYLYWNMDRVYNFRMTEFVPLIDEFDASLRAGIRFWRIDPKKPLNCVLYEEDGYTKYRTDENGTLRLVEKKRAYKVEYQYTEAGDVLYTNEENYTRLPIVCMYATRLKQSTLVGMRDAIDAYDLISSGFANDLIDCAQIYWIVENYGGMDDADLAEFLDKLKFNHIANIDSASGGAVKPYTQDLPTTGRSVYLAEIKQRIYDDFGALDVHTVQASNTNDHIDAAYQPMDENAADFEHWVGDAIGQLLDIIGIKDTPIFRRNKVSNKGEEAEMALAEAPYIDKATLLRKLPNITPDEARAILANPQIRSAQAESAMETAAISVMNLMANGQSVNQQALEMNEGTLNAGGNNAVDLSDAESMVETK
jgi:hypothetical protein